jgi:hypothetical protein
MVGGMTDFHMLPEYKMIYDERVKGYTGRMYLKQGYYNYQFAVPDKYGNPDFTPLEGNWYAAENQYTILCYYRPRGGQYDQLVGLMDAQLDLLTCSQAGYWLLSTYVCGAYAAKGF